MQAFYSFASTIFTTVNNLSKPNSDYIRDKQQLELCHRRHQAVVIINLISFAHFLINFVIDSGHRESNIQGILSTLGICIALFIHNYLGLHPQVFNTIFNMHSLLFCIILQNKDDYGIFGAYLAIPVYPFFVYFFTGSITHFVINNICQVALLHGMYQDIMRKSLAYMSVDDTIKVMTHFTNHNVLYCVLYTGLAHFTLQNALYKARVAEREKENIERQKNFLLGFSHELRNLINSLMGNVKLASLERLSDRVKELLLNAEVCSELLLHLVNNILDTGKAEIGDLEVNPVPTRIYDVVERIWGVCSELIKRKNLKGRVKIQRDIPQILVLDHYRITQVFLNLVGNAIKFTDSGHINMTIEWIPNKGSVDDKCFEPYPFNEKNDHDEGLFEKSQAFSIFDEEFISLNFTRKKIDRKKLPTRVNFSRGVLKVSVIDTGCGIIKEDLGKLFQRFQQGTTDPSKKKLGTGLGLFITKELCQRMHGEAKVFSKPGLGSAFIFCLAMQPGADEPGYFFDSEGVQQRSLICQEKLKSMIVDDEHFSQNILRDFMSKLNVEVTVLAEDGLVAYRKLVERIAQKEYINIVTMDINMSVMDGKMAAQKIRELEKEKNLKPCLLIMVSGNCGESVIAECLDKRGKIRADAFIKKPVRIEELSTIIWNRFMRRQEN